MVWEVDSYGSVGDNVLIAKLPIRLARQHARVQVMTKF